MEHFICISTTVAFLLYVSFDTYHKIAINKKLKELSKATKLLKKF